MIVPGHQGEGAAIFNKATGGAVYGAQATGRAMSAMPVIGHGKGAVLLVVGHKEEGQAALQLANKSSVAVGKAGYKVLAQQQHKREPQWACHSPCTPHVSFSATRRSMVYLLWATSRALRTWRQATRRVSFPLHCAQETQQCHNPAAAAAPALVCSRSAGGNRALISATRSTAVVGAAAAVVASGGTVLAVAGVGVAAGVAYDAAHTGVDSKIHHEYRPHGHVEFGTKVATGKAGASTKAWFFFSVLLPCLALHGFCS